MPRIDSHQGFVFASMAADGPSLAEHLGEAAAELDRLARLSPEGKVELTAGWLKHRTRANWKLLAENETDGYHRFLVALPIPHGVGVTAPAGQELDLRQIEQFVYREARYADEHDYDAWEALWTDDAIYWVPAGGDPTEPGAQMSVIYDNWSRIATRLNQLRTGQRHAQSPPSGLRRVTSNIEVLDRDGSDTIVGANFVLAESRERGVETWAGRITYRPRTVDGGLRLAGKQILLVNRDRPLPTLAFLI